ncbi:MAG: hypothetical protein AB7L13_12080 [Acidimicrobiia bacterium]
MAVGEGKFLLYSFIDPPLSAGDYRFRVDQLLSATGEGGTRDADDLPVDQLDTFVRVRAPRYQLPPDQVLSTFPPANTEGSYGSRLPQIVIKRRTLPWERDLTGQPSTTPWLALVLIAEGEATLQMNQPVADCVTPGTVLGGVVDTELGNYLEIRKSVVDKVFPTRKDVPLLAHAREVDINDTELMMGDDDGFLAVVVSNRLPVAGHDASGNEVPVKYLACLVNLEGQFDRLLPEAPPPSRFSPLDLYEHAAIDIATWDHVMSGHSSKAVFHDPDLLDVDLAAGSSPRAASPRAGTTRAGAAAASAASFAKTTYVPQGQAGAQAYEPTSGWTLDDSPKYPNVYQQMAKDFSLVASNRLDDVVAVFDPVYRFPVLLHWSFTSTGDTTFRYLMEHVDSGLLGTVPEPSTPVPPGREAIEVVETGHVGLPHRTRRGDSVRAWYRGPFVPHPTVDPPTGRLALAHASDQLRIVVPDGREDLSLASAFEIGRLLALARPAIVGSLLRWRQTGYQAARRKTVWQGNRDLFDVLLGDRDKVSVDSSLYTFIGREIVKRVAANPVELFGPPRALFDPGEPLDIRESTLGAIAAGFGFGAEVVKGSPAQILSNVRSVDVPVAGSFVERLDPKMAGPALQAGLDRALVDLVSDALAPELKAHPVVGSTVPRDGVARRRRRDRLDELLKAAAASSASDDEEERPR